ncbi:MAG: formimidoylglutamase [Betaproteobacteria bacterium]|nr:MAG: formimidoylglutamase [Betaproteobacteria bacterium]
MSQDWRLAWQGRVDGGDGEAGLRWHQIVEPWREGARRGVALLGFASDEGVRRNQGRIGAAQGPQALRRLLANLPVHSRFALYDAGDVTCEGGSLEAAQDDYAARAAMLLDEGQLAVGLGGGHEIARASYLALARSRAMKSASAKLGILNFDAHFDLRKDERSTSGTPFLQALDHAAANGLAVEYRCLGISESSNTRALFDRARERGVVFRRDDELTLLALDARMAELADWLRTIDHLYLTVCLDVLPASVAPGVSAPAARGVALEVLEPLIALAAGSGKLRLADIAELCPPHDIDQRTARVAARIAWRIVQSHLDAPR